VHARLLCPGGPVSMRCCTVSVVPQAQGPAARLRLTDMQRLCVRRVTTVPAEQHVMRLGAHTVLHVLRFWAAHCLLGLLQRACLCVMLSAAAPLTCRAVATFMREALLEHTKRLAMATGAGSSA
jgi:hypothetical protein